MAVIPGPFFRHSSARPCALCAVNRARPRNDVKNLAVAEETLGCIRRPVGAMRWSRLQTTRKGLSNDRSKREARRWLRVRARPQFRRKSQRNRYIGGHLRTSRDTPVPGPKRASSASAGVVVRSRCRSPFSRHFADLPQTTGLRSQCR